MNRVLLEVPVESLDEARIAIAAGADRLELCANLACDGLTPLPETLAQFAQAAPAPFVVMIRPRAGDFRYAPDEIHAMERSIAAARRAGARGVVFGALDAHNALDIPACTQLRDAAAGCETVFHRAFDAVADPRTSLDRLIELAFTRVLTSGGCGCAADPANRAQIRELMERAAKRIEILPGGAIRANNVAVLLRDSGCHAIHSACRTRGAQNRLGLLDARMIRELRVQLDSLRS